MTSQYGAYALRVGLASLQQRKMLIDFRKRCGLTTITQFKKPKGRCYIWKEPGD